MADGIFDRQNMTDKIPLVSQATTAVTKLSHNISLYDFNCTDRKSAEIVRQVR